jgi:RND family efflux transporter MFP subunit
MPTAECPNRSTLFDYLVGKLPEDASDSLSSHVESCPDCQAELATLSDIEDTLIGQLRGAAAPDAYLDESECSRAVAKAKGVAEEGKGDSPRLPESQTSLPTHLGEYRLIERLGGGGMGAVYKAVHSRLDRVVALKILPRARTDDQRAIVRFEREMKAIGRLDHPHIVRAYDAREIDDRLVLVMEFVEGLDLGKIVRRLGRIDAADACELARQAALGLQVAHEHGMVHRDVKPSNLMLTPEGQVKLLDLGLARFQGGLSQYSSVGMAVQLPSQPSDAADDMTGTGQAMGTADYMAPEQTSDSRTVDIRADVYSLGATLYKLLSGRAPFSGPEYQGTFDKMLAHRQTSPPPIEQFCPAIPEGLAAVLDRMLAKDPAARYQTPTEAAEALAPFCAGSDLPTLLRRAEASTPSPLPPGEGQGEGIVSPNPLPTPRPWRTIAAVVIALLLVGGLGFWLGVIIHIRNQNGEEATLNVPNGSDVRVDDQGKAHVTVPGAVPKEKAPQNADLQFEIAKVAAELAAQRALLNNVDEAGLSPVEVDQLVQNDPVAKQLSTELGWKKMDQTYAEGAAKKDTRNAFVKRQKDEVNRLQKQYDERVKEIETKIRQKRRAFIQTEIVRLQAMLAALRQQQGGPQEAAAPAGFDVKAIQGTWEIVSSTFKLIEPLDRGENVTPDQVRQTTKIIITADSFKVMGEHVVNQDFAYQLKLDAAPKMIDLASGGRASLGIFQLTGNELKICASPLGSRGAPQRPSEFWAELGSGKELLVLRRVGDAVVSDDEKAILGTWRVETPLVHALGIPYPDSQLFADQKQEVVISMHTMKFLPSAESDGSHSGMRVGRGGHAGSEEAYALDPNSRPKIIDLTCYWRMPILATYELQGDHLTVCCEPGSWQRSARPTKLAADDKTHTALVVLKRVSKPAEKPKGAASQPAVVAPGSVPEVPVCRPVLRDVTDYRDFVGHTEASQTVDVRARITGEVQKVLFTAGAIKQGDRIFEIDPRWCEAELDKYTAELFRAKASRQVAALELTQANEANRKVPGTVAKMEVERRAGEVKKAEAAIAAAEAELNLAKLNIEYTTIRAPIGGVISRPQATVGNLVAAGTQTLATIVCSDPLYVVFDVDERSVLDLRRQAAEEKAKTGRELPTEVRCGMANEKDCPRRAAIESKDARMDPATGTARWRATLPNPDGVLMPGMFARVRLLVGSPHQALLIPEQSLGSDQGRRFVFVIDKKNTVERRFVETGQLAGELRAVIAGLTADDWVIVHPSQAISRGMIATPKLETPPGSPPPPITTAADKGGKQEKPLATPTRFRTATVTRGDITASVYAAGTIEPDEMFDIGTAVAGQVVSLGRGSDGKPIDYMSPVEPGTILAKIDPTVYKARLDQEEAALRRAQAEVALAEAKGKSQTPEVAKASREAAGATRLQCESALSLAKRNLDYTVIASPVKGVIIDRRVNVGQNVSPAGPNAPSLFLIAKDLRKMQVWAQVNEADVPRIRKGMTATFTVDAFPKETFRGMVSQIRLNAAMLQNVVTYTVIVSFDNPDLKLMPFLTANVQFQVEKRSNVLRVPNGALRWKPVPDLVGSNAATPEAQGAMRSLPPGTALWIKTPDGQHVQRIPINVGLSDGLLKRSVVRMSRRGWKS